MPFRTLDDQPLLAIELRQVGPKDFQLISGFRYLDPTRGDTPHEVPPHDVMKPKDNSDLASVPFFLWWFIASYGHQTAPALLHDHLLRSRPDFRARREIDRVFRVALDEVGVGFFRCWIMWAAVSLLTIWKCQKPLFVVLAAQLVLGILAVLAFPWFEWLGVPWWLWPLLPLAGCVLWWRWFAIPLIGTYVGAFLLPATAGRAGDAAAHVGVALRAVGSPPRPPARRRGPDRGAVPGARLGRVNGALHASLRAIARSSLRGGQRLRRIASRMRRPR